MKVIVISGPTGSGKTTLSSQILGKYKNGISLSTDNYYKTGIISKIFSILIESYFDRKISFNYKLFEKDFNFISKNGISEHQYLYDFKSKTIKKFSLKKNKIEYLIIEGIFAKELLVKLKIKSLFFIELKANKSSCMKRVIDRDINERGKIKKYAKNDFLKSWNYYYRKNIRKKKEKKDFIYSETSNINLGIKEFLNLNN